ncbi:hypothetical protein C8R46DRAFT_1018635 [Mycena filopes]|nr:hypothetical protein C8R46DRAFT_1018635 [Mycena filopes]
MTSWIGEVKEQAFNMTEAGMEVSEHDQILAMTGGLPSAYSTTIATFDSTPPSSLTLDYVVGQLLSAETQNGPRTRGPSTPVADTGDALAVQSVTRCYICDETGHVKRDCPFRSAIEQLKKKKTAGTGSANLAIGLDEESDSDPFEIE